MGQRRGKFYEALVEGLLTFAGHRFRLELVQPDGSTAEQTDTSARRQFEAAGLKPPKALVAKSIGPECPPAVEYLWGYFREISLGIAAAGFGLPVVTWEALAAWRHLRGIDLEPWEALAIIRMGDLRAGIIAENQKNGH